MSTHTHIRDLITRLARLNAAETWSDGLNPAQVSALGYLSRANRFSRSPSHVAEYLGTTRGTMSQTLKALERKGYVFEVRSKNDKRSIAYQLRPKGTQLVARSSALEDVIDVLPVRDKSLLEDTLLSALLSLVKKYGGRPFGMCKTCRYHRQENGAPYCGLLELVLRPEETTQICNEQRP